MNTATKYISTQENPTNDRKDSQKGGKPMPQLNKKPWSNSEVSFLTESYESGLPVAQIATELDRSERSISGKAHCLGLVHKTFTEQRYAANEDQYLKQYSLKKTAQVIANALGRSIGSVRQRANRLGIRFYTKEKNTQYQKNHMFFDQPSMENCYIAGLIASDGWIRPVSSDKPINQVGISVAKKDIAILKKLKKKVGYTGPIREYEVDGMPQAELRINGVPQWIEDLDEHWGIKPQKSLTISKPPNQLDRLNQLAYLVGLIEGDGSIRINNKTLEITYATGSKDFAYWIRDTWQELVEAVPGFAVYTKNRKNPAYYITLHGSNARKLCHLLMGTQVTRMNRKCDVSRLAISKFSLKN